MLRAKDRLLRRAQPASGRVLRATAIFDQNVAPAQQRGSETDSQRPGPLLLLVR